MAQQLAYNTGNPKLQSTGDLAIIAFYYLLISGEYTKPQKLKQNKKLVRATKTQQFSVQYVGFWKNVKILSRRETLNILLEADSEILKFQIRKWKNGANLEPQFNGQKWIYGIPITYGTPYNEQ